MPANVSVDVLVTGGGFGGMYSVYKVRKLGLSVHLFEAGNTIGGTWYWNAYPGARVDSEFPMYQLSIPEVYRDWNWSERFPGVAELRKYFEHVDKVLNISKDSTFNAEVIDVRFDESTSKWTVKTKQGHEAVCRFLILATGSTYKRYYPSFPGVDTYKGPLYHSGLWPAEGVDVRGKKVAVIGSGATGVQVVQELSKQAGETTCFVRTPNIALPMRQRKLTVEEQNVAKGFFQAMLRTAARSSYGGFPYDLPATPSAFSVSDEEREALYEELYNRGGFHPVVGIWPDYLFDPKANRAAYDFWAKKTRARISDPVKRDILAPLEPLHPFMTKRPSLEQDYYECMDQKNLTLVDLNQTPIEAFNEAGIKTADGKQHDFDLIVFATGFDNYTGAFSTMGIKDTKGVELRDRWQDGVHTYLGLMCTGFPNMWMVYGPQAPTALGNGPTIIEVQIDVIIDMIEKAHKEGASRIEPTVEAEKEWTDDIQATAKFTLMTQANSWYMGANIPGKKREMLNYLKGLVLYEKSCREALDGWKGLNVIKAPA